MKSSERHHMLRQSETKQFAKKIAKIFLFLYPAHLDESAFFQSKHFSRTFGEHENVENF